MTDASQRPSGTVTRRFARLRRIVHVFKVPLSIREDTSVNGP